MTVSRKNAGISVLAVILVLCELASLTVLFSRMAVFSADAFKNVMPLVAAERKDGISYAPAISYPTAILSPGEEAQVSGDAEGTAETPSTEAPATDAPLSGALPGANTGRAEGESSRPEFRMVAEAEIFKFSYDETGKITVIGSDGDADKLIAPGTSNLYQFTLENPGNVALDYRLEMEAYYTGTDLWIPVNARVWDYTNKYLVGSPDEMADVLELNTVNETAELGAGRYATYTLEWEWPFERGENGEELDENDIYDTMLGNLAVDEDLVLTIVIRTVAEYDEEPNDPNAGLPPKTGDDFPLGFVIAICVLSLFGICVLFFTGGKRKNNKHDDCNREDNNRYSGSDGKKTE